MLVLLAVVDDGLVPGPLSLNVGLVFGVAGVQLDELVALVVGSYVEDGFEIITTDDEGTLNDGVTVLAKDGGAAEEVLARTLQTVVEAADQVVGHESQGELVIVPVLELPNGVLIEGNVLPEPLERLGLIVVRVVALPLVKSESSLGQSLKRVLGPGGLSGLLSGSGLGGSLLLGSRLLLRLLGLLGGNIGELRGVEELELGCDSRVDGLVVDSLVPSRDIGVLLAPLLVEEELEATGNDGDSKQISEGDSLADQISVVLQVLLNGGNGLRGQFGGIVDVLLVVGVAADQGTVPLAQRGENLGLRSPR